jgi:hypothetical protein
MLDLERELDSVRNALVAHGIEYALCGGLAVGIHGFPRATVDIDLLIRRESEEQVYAAVEPLGFTIRARPMNFGSTEIRHVSKIDRSDGEVLMLDLLLVTPPFEHVWESRERKEWLGQELYVVSREGLIALKEGRSSQLDLADIERLRGGHEQRRLFGSSHHHAHPASVPTPQTLPLARQGQAPPSQSSLQVLI